MIDGSLYPILSTLESPKDLRELPKSQLVDLANELREYLIHSVSGCGGHFSAGLGTIELTVALHYIYNTPDDRLIWDVGHQCYPHKILTGRRDQISTIRQKDGLSPFLKRKESEYDAFGAGHSSTSISVALGMAVAAQQLGLDRKAVAIIGDGAMTAGLAYEALDHGGMMEDIDLLVILNDNEMSISPNVGALSAYLTKLLSGRVYSKVHESGKKVLSNIPSVWKLAKRTEKQVKGMITPGSLFEDLGFHYFGPIDGHDLPNLVQTLHNLHGLKGPRLLHVVTQKGKGYNPAEEDPIKYHGVTPFNPKTGIQTNKQSTANKPSYSKIFGQWICDMAKQDERLIGITPAMREGSGLVEFEQQFPNRYFDVGIAEQHAVTFAAGLAAEGLKPVVAIYSTFLQRGYDQVVHDVALQKLPVLFAIDRAGLVGPDGPTHAGSFDYTFLRSLPDFVIMAPSNENECRQMLYTGFTLNQPAAVRYPRGTGPGVEVQTQMRTLPIGRAEEIYQGENIVLLSFGTMLDVSRIVAKELNASLINMRFVKPLDVELILKYANTHQYIVTLEENVIPGGAGVAVHEVLSEYGLNNSILHIGLPDRSIEHGSREEMLENAELDQNSVLKKIKSQWKFLIKRNRNSTAMTA